MSEQKIVFENKAAHVKHLALGTGQTIVIPPTADGGPKTTVVLTSEAELTALRAVLQQEVVAAWLTSGELVVDGQGADLSAPPPAAPSDPNAPPPAAPADPNTQRTPNTPNTPNTPSTPSGEPLHKQPDTAAFDTGSGGSGKRKG